MPGVAESVGGSRSAGLTVGRVKLRKVLKTRGHMPHDQAALKLMFLAIRNAKKRWGYPDKRHWAQARLQFAIHFGERFPGRNLPWRVTRRT